MARPSAGVMLVMVLVAACNQGTSTSQPDAGTSAISAPPASVSSSSAGPLVAPGSPATVDQTDTEWGRIWDAVPAAFPVYPGAVPSDEAQAGPASATYTIAAEEARAVAGWMQAELERSAYRTEALNGPMEDGGFILESTGDAGCRIQIATTPRGGMTIVTVRYGASCPSP